MSTPLHVVDGLGVKRHLGAVKKRAEPDKRELVLTGGAGVVVPPTYLDRQAELPPVYDQGEEGSCTANMVTLALLHAEREELQQSVEDLRARQFAYNATRIYEGTPLAEDDGATIGGAFAAVAKYGICKEELFPYGPQNLAVTPPQVAYDDAATMRIRQFTRVVGVPAIQVAITRGHILGFGIDVPEQMMSEEAAKSGIVPWVDGQKIVGGHALVCWGWGTDEAGKLWAWVRNSWGEAWGQGGNFMLDARFVVEALASDFYYIQSLDVTAAQILAYGLSQAAKAPQA